MEVDWPKLLETKLLVKLAGYDRPVDMRVAEYDAGLDVWPTGPGTPWVPFRPCVRLEHAGTCRESPARPGGCLAGWWFVDQVKVCAVLA